MAGRNNFAGSDGHDFLPFKHFFKVVWPETILNQKLMLPEKFGMTFRDKLSPAVSLKVRDGRVWTVRLTKERRSRNRVWLNSGFGDFLSFYSIAAGHLLFFKYNGGSDFQVVICDTCACEVTYPSMEEHHISDGSEPDSDDDDDEDGEEEEEDSGSDNQGNEGERPLSAAEEDSDSSADYSAVKRVATTGRRDGASASASSRREHLASGMDRGVRHRLAASSIVTSAKFSSSFEELPVRSKEAVKRAVDRSNPENPKVLMVIRRFNITGIMYLPTIFSKKYFRRDAEPVTLRAHEENGEFVGESVMLAERKARNVVFINGGWTVFCVDHCLAEGDVCLFSLMNQAETRKVLNVHIFRA